MLSETAAMDEGAADCSGLASAGLVITCEHGGNRIPAPYRDLFHAHQALLDSHRGYDSGALIMARALATSFAAEEHGPRPLSKMVRSLQPRPR